MSVKEILYKRVSTSRSIGLVTVASCMIVIVATVCLYLYLLPRADSQLAPNHLGRDAVSTLPALLFLAFLCMKFRRSHRMASNRRMFFPLLLMPSAMLYVAGVLLIYNPVMRRYVGELESTVLLLVPVMLCNFVLMLIFAFLYVYIRGIQTRLSLVMAERERANFQFHLLRNQMNPHFLFNALNVAASLPYEDAEKASLFIKRLGALYRYMLQTSEKQQVALRTEMEFAQSYIYLEKVRFGEKLQVSTDIDDTLMDSMVVPGSVQMLIENAVKHNTGSEESPLRVHILADQEGVTVSNNIQLRDPEALPGQGLRNLGQQYAQLGRHIRVTRDGDRFVVRLPFV